MNRVAKLTQYKIFACPFYQLKDTFTYKAFTLSFSRIGQGQRHFLAFHGFGSSPKDLAPVENLLTTEHTLWMFDLFHHGNGSYPADRIRKDTLRPSEMAELILAFMSGSHIEAIGLIGFSLGGKICLTLVEHIPERITQCILFAPDGIKIHPAYRFASRSLIGMGAFRSIIKWPNIFFAVVKSAAAIGLVSKKDRDIVLFNMESQKKRQLLYDVWMSYREFRPDLDAINSNCKKYGIQFTALFGKYDHVIPVKHGDHLGRSIPVATVLTLESGHLDLVARVVRKYPELLSIKKGAKAP